MSNKVPPRSVPSRHEKYMGLAFLISAFSKDPNTQHGAVIVSSNNFPLGWGYNGPPRQMNDNAIHWGRDDIDGYLRKYPYINHAERNAINHSKKELLDGATLYVTGKPCPTCMLEIVTSGIKRVIYYSDLRHYDSDSSMCMDQNVSETDRIAKDGYVQLEEFRSNLNWMDEWNMHLRDDLGIFDVIERI